jgi:hypothetical protein
VALGYRLDSAPNDPDSPVVTWFGAIDLSPDQLVGADGAPFGQLCNFHRVRYIWLVSPIAGNRTFDVGFLPRSFLSAMAWSSVIPSTL